MTKSLKPEDIEVVKDSPTPLQFVFSDSDPTDKTVEVIADSDPIDGGDPPLI